MPTTRPGRHREAIPRYIRSAGCEVVRDTPDENLLAMRDYAFEAPLDA